MLRRLLPCALFAVPCHLPAQVLADTLAVVRAVGAHDASAVANGRAHPAWFINVGADSVYERAMAEARGTPFRSLPGGVTPRCHESVAGDAPVGSNVRVTVTFASADSGVVGLRVRCASPSVLGSSFIAYTVARRDGRWVVLRVSAIVSD